MVVLRHYFTLCMYEEASPGWQNTACMLVLVAVRGQHRHEASRGHRRVAGVMDMAELLESWTWPSCWSHGHGRVAGVVEFPEGASEGKVYCRQVCDTRSCRFLEG